MSEISNISTIIDNITHNNNLSATQLNLDDFLEDLKKEEKKQSNYIFEKYEWKKYISEKEKHAILDHKNKSAFKLESAIYSGESGVGKTVNSLLLLKQYLIDFNQKNQIQIQNNNNFIYWFAPTYIKFNEIIRLVEKLNFGSEKEKSEAIETIEDLKQVKFLIIDDFSAKKSGSKSSSYHDNKHDMLLQDIFDLRYGNSDKNITIITTNEKIEDWANVDYSFLSKKTISRIVGSVKARFYNLANTQDRRLDV